MSCYTPLPAWMHKASVTASGKKVVVLSEKHGDQWESITLPCGKCIGCRIDYSRMWAVRCMHESELHASNCFLTLTYSDDSLPSGGSLVKRDLQLFFKRLRKQLGSVKVRYYAAGEYGESLLRPHYHIILFGHDFAEDRVLWKVSHGSKLYRSSLLEQCWPYGYSLVADVNYKTCAYVARYVTKKIGGKLADSHYAGLQPEFSVMSRRPGIARDWINKYIDDVYPADYVVMDGIKLRPPRYYDIVYDITEDDMDDIKERRFDNVDINNCSYDRLQVRKKVAESKFNNLIRSYEND